MQPYMGAAEVGATDADVSERGIACLDVGDGLRCSGAGSLVLWVIDMLYVTAHWEDVGTIPPQG